MDTLDWSAEHLPFGQMQRLASSPRASSRKPTDNSKRYVIVILECQYDTSSVNHTYLDTNSGFFLGRQSAKLHTSVIRTFSSLQAGSMNPNPFEIKKQPVLVAKRANPPAPNGNSKTIQVEDRISAEASQLILAITSMARLRSENASEGETVRLGEFKVLSCVATIAYEPPKSGKVVENQKLEMICRWEDRMKPTVKLRPARNSEEHSKDRTDLNTPAADVLSEDKEVIPKADAPTEGQKKKEGQKEKAGKGKEKQEDQKNKEVQKKK
ncbi:uncharacterized protein LOC125538573 [Triticum urartu]|nr:uncharacterized protein LOC125538573 [Triticum urartu]